MFIGVNIAQLLESETVNSVLRGASDNFGVSLKKLALAATDDADIRAFVGLNLGIFPIPVSVRLPEVSADLLVTQGRRPSMKIGRVVINDATLDKYGYASFSAQISTLYSTVIGRKMQDWYFL